MQCGFYLTAIAHYIQSRVLVLYVQVAIDIRLVWRETQECCL